MNPSKIAFVLSSRFPTEKAYGVTTRESVLSLLKMKQVVRVFARQSDYIDLNFDEIMDAVRAFSENYFVGQLFKIASSGKGIFSKVAWKMGCSLNLNRNLNKIIEFNPEIVWTREIEIAKKLTTKLPRAKIILEIHTKPRKKKFAKLLKYNSRILFCPINENINDHIKKFLNNDTKIQIAPMSINKNFVNTNEDVKKFIKRLKNDKLRTVQIGYVGKFSPNGYSKGIEILFDLAIKFQEKNLNFKVNIIGGDKSEMYKFEKLKKRLKISDEYLNIQGHVAYFKVPDILRSLDVLILPNPSSADYSGTPLKLLEYLASGRIVILADVEFIRRANIPGISQWIFNSRNSNELYTKICGAINDPDLEVKLITLIGFASSETWEKRTTNLVNHIKSL